MFGIVAMGAGRPVLASTWQEAAALENFLIGRGVNLLCGAWGPTLGAGTWDFRYWVYGNSQHATRVWVITLANSESLAVPGASTGAQNGYGSVTIEGSLTVPFVIPGMGDDSGDPVTLYIPYEYPTLSPKSVELACSVTVGTLSRGIDVHSISCYDAPLANLDAVGVAPSSCKVGAPIYNGTSVKRSIGGITGGNWTVSEDIVHRSSLFDYANWINTTPTSQLPQSATPTVYTDFLSGVHPAIQTRITRIGETTRNVTVRILCRQTSGTGNIRLTMTNGATTNANVTGSSFAWKTFTIAVNTDDPSLLATGGIRGAARDEMLVEVKCRVSGTGETIIKSICVRDQYGV